MTSRRRAREDDTDDYHNNNANGSRVHKKSGSHRSANEGISLFGLELEKCTAACFEYLNTKFKENVEAVDLDQPPSSSSSKDGIPEYRFLNLVGEYTRAAQEVDLRFAGTVGTPYCFGSNDTFAQGLPDLTDQEDQQVENFVPHPLGVPLYNVRQIRAGGTSVAALTTEGKVYTWGSSDDGV